MHTGDYDITSWLVENGNVGKKLVQHVTPQSQPTLIR